MRVNRKGGLLLLMVAVLWAALPAVACALVSGAAAPPCCCRGMARSCPMRGTNARNACCQAHETSPVIAPDARVLPDASQVAVFLPRATSGVLASASGQAWLAFGASPPGAAPGKTSILRI